MQKDGFTSSEYRELNSMLDEFLKNQTDKEFNDMYDELMDCLDVIEKSLKLFKEDDVPEELMDEAKRFIGHSKDASTVIWRSGETSYKNYDALVTALREVDYLYGDYEEDDDY